MRFAIRLPYYNPGTNAGWHRALGKLDDVGYKKPKKSIVQSSKYGGNTRGIGGKLGGYA